MRIAIYGLPGSGKTSLIESIPNVKALSGRQELDRLSSGQFSNMTEEEKRDVRVRYTEFLSELDDDVIVSDGHYSFVDNVVFTDSDGDIYDVIFYLFCKPSELLKRYALSEKNKKYCGLTEGIIYQWQEYEIESLRNECHKRNKDFYVISDNGNSTAFYEFFDMVVKGYSTVNEAITIASAISNKYHISLGDEVIIVDGDKTIIEQDSYRFCYNGKTNVFDGDFYTGYQSFLYSRELVGIGPIPNVINEITLNSDVWNRIKDSRYVVLSSGISAVWNRLKEIFGFAEVIANPMISADSKFYIVKFLREKGYKICSYGDSKNDIYMLKESNVGNLVLGKRISRSLVNTDVDGLNLIYDKHPYFLTDNATDSDHSDIAICKSNSGINGSRLAAAHLRLGQRMGSILASAYPSHNTAVVVLDRGGRFFGDGLFSTFGGVLYPCNPSKDPVPQINNERIVIVDSVINTGKSIKKMISVFKAQNPDCDIVVVSNVIQQAAIELLDEYKIYVVRSSVNAFVGNRQAKQTGNKGPDTADRLYNLIDRSF